MSGLSLVNSTSNGDMSSTINGAGSGAVELSDSGRALKLQTDSPHLVSMGGDRLSTSVTLHPIPQGSQKKPNYSFHCISIGLRLWFFVQID